MIEQKCMNFDPDFGYSFPFSLPSKKKEEEKENELVKLVIKGHLLDHIFFLNKDILQVYNQTSIS